MIDLITERIRIHKSAKQKAQHEGRIADATYHDVILRELSLIYREGVVTSKPR